MNQRARKIELYRQIDLLVPNDAYPVAFVVRRVTDVTATLEYVPVIGAYVPDVVEDDMPSTTITFDVPKSKVLGGDALSPNMLVLALRRDAFPDSLRRYRYTAGDGSLLIDINRLKTPPRFTGYHPTSSPTSFPPPPAYSIDTALRKRKLSTMVHAVRGGDFSQFVILDQSYDSTGRAPMYSWWKNRVLRIPQNTEQVVLRVRIYAPGPVEFLKNRGNGDPPLVALRHVSNTVLEAAPSKNFDANEYALETNPMEQWVANLDPFPLPPVPEDAPDDYTRIGYVEFRLPPSQVSVSTETSLEVSPLLRSAGTHKRMAHVIHRRWAMQIVLEGEDINRIMVPLLRQVDRMPFLPVVNNVLNANGITVVSIDNVQISTVPETPNVVSLTLEGSKFHEEQLLNPLPLLFCINWPLFKMYTDYLPRFFPVSMPWNGRVAFLFPTREYLQERVQELTEYIELPGGERVRRSEVVSIENVIQTATTSSAQFTLPRWILDKQGTYFHAPLPDGKTYYVWVAANSKAFAGSLAWAAGGGHTPLVPRVHRIYVGRDGDITVDREPLTDAQIAALLRGADKQDIKQYLFAIPSKSPLRGVKIEDLLQTNVAALASEGGVLARNLEKLKKEREREKQKRPDYFEVDLGNIVWQNISVSYQNLITEIDGPEEIAVQQFLGRSDLTAVLKGVGDQNAVDRLNMAIKLFRDISFLFRGLGIVRDIHVQMRVQNELLNLMGFNSCIPVGLEVNTIPGTPNLYEITLQLVSFDPSQFEREYVRRLSEITAPNVFARTSTPNFAMDDNTVRVGPISRAYESHAFHRSLQSVETYPDLRLPTFSMVNRWMRLLAEMKDTSTIRSMLDIYSRDDLEHIRSAFNKQLNGIGLDGQKKPPQKLPETDNYVDPDFFISTMGVGGSQTLSSVLQGTRSSDKTYIAVGSDGTQARISDTTLDIHNVSPETLREYARARQGLETSFRLQNIVSNSNPVTKSRPRDFDGRDTIRMFEDRGDSMVLSGGILGTQDGKRFAPLSVSELSVASTVQRMNDMLVRQRKLEGYDGPYKFSLTPAASDRLLKDGIGQEILRKLSDSRFVMTLMLSTVEIESGFNPNARSGAGAMGLTQIIPSTWNNLKRQYFYLSDPNVTPFEAPTLAVAASLVYYITIMRELLKKRDARPELRDAINAIWNDNRLLIQYLWGVYNGSRSEALIQHLGLGQGDARVASETRNALPKLKTAIDKYHNYYNSDFIRRMSEVDPAWKRADKSDTRANLTLEQIIQQVAEEARNQISKFRKSPPGSYHNIPYATESFIREKFKELKISAKFNISEQDFVMRVKIILYGEGRVQLPTQSGQGGITGAAALVEKQVLELLKMNRFRDLGRENEVRQIISDFVKNPSRPRPIYNSLQERDALIEYGVSFWKNLVQGKQTAQRNVPDSAQSAANPASPAARAKNSEIEEHGHALAGKDLTVSGWNDEVKYMPYGRMLMCFPTYCVLLVYGGRWIRFWRFWDQWYGMFGVVSIDVYKNKHSPTHVAELNVSNMFNSLTNTAADFVLNNALIRSMQWSEYDVVERIYTRGEDPIVQLWRSVRAWLLPRIGEFERRVWETELRSLLIRPGARLHVRLGYGADASKLAPVFNGTISEIRSDDNLLNIVALGDGKELEAPADMSGSGGKRGGDQPEYSYRFTGIFGIPVEPRRAIVDFFVSTKADTVKIIGPIIYALSMGQYLNANMYGINNFGLTEDLTLGGAGGGLALRVRPGETGVNIYNSTPAGSTYSPNWAPFVDFFTLGLSQYFTEGIHASFDIKNASIWDAINMIRMVVHDYIAAVEPFDLHSTLFVGAPDYPFYYTYRAPQEMGIRLSDANKRLNGYRYSDLMRYKQFQQFHLAVSRINMVKNGIELSREGLITDCTATDTSDVKGNWIQLDPMIIPEDRKNVTVQSGVNTSSIALLSPFSPEFDPLQWLARFRLLRPLTEQVGLARPTRVVNNVARNVIREAMMNMYQGAVSLVGNPSIKPHDICVFDDASRLMEGIVGVREVEHHFSAVHGFITSFSPELVVTMMSDKEAVRVVHLRALGENLLTNLVLLKRFAYRKAAITTEVMIRGGLLRDASALNRIRQTITASRSKLPQILPGLPLGGITNKGPILDDAQRVVDDIVDALVEVGRVDRLDADLLRDQLKREIIDVIDNGKSLQFKDAQQAKEWLAACLDTIEEALEAEVELSKGGTKIRVPRTVEAVRKRRLIGVGIGAWLNGFRSYVREYLKSAFEFFLRDNLKNLHEWKPIEKMAILNHPEQIRNGGRIHSSQWLEDLGSVWERAKAFIKTHKQPLQKPMKETLLPILNVIFGLGIRKGGGLLSALFNFTGRKVLFLGSALDMINRWLSSFYPCMMYPLTVEGKEFTTGIRGHSGTVFGDSPSIYQNLLTIFDPKTPTNKLFGGLWGDGPSSTVFDIVRKGMSLLVARELSATLTSDQIDEALRGQRMRYSDIKIYTEDIDEAYDKARIPATGTGAVNRASVEAVRKMAEDPNLPPDVRTYLSRVAQYPDLIDADLVEYIYSRNDPVALKRLIEEHRKKYTANVSQIQSLLGARGVDLRNPNLFVAETLAHGYPPYNPNLYEFLKVLREELDRRGQSDIRFYVNSSVRPLWYQRGIYFGRYGGTNAGDGLPFTEAEKQAFRAAGFGNSGMPAAKADPASPSPHSRGTAVDLQFYRAVPNKNGGYTMRIISSRSIPSDPVNAAIARMKAQGINIIWGIKFNDPVHFEVR